MDIGNRLIKASVSKKKMSAYLLSTILRTAPQRLINIAQINIEHDEIYRENIIAKQTITSVRNRL